MVHDDLQEVIAVQEIFKKKLNDWHTELTDEEERISSENWCEERTEEINRFVENTQASFVIAAKNNIEEQLESQSQLTRTTKSTTSKRSTNSRIKERERDAELQAKLTTLSPKQHLQNEIEKVNLQEQLAIIQAKEKLYEEELRNSRGHSDVQHDHTPWEPRLPTPSMLKPEPLPFLDADPFVDPFVPDMHYQDMKKTLPKEEIKTATSLDREPLLQFLDKQNELTEILAKQHQQSLLPRVQLSSFSNNPLDFDTFMRNFQSQVESKTDSSQVCLQYLEQCLQGEAKELIKGCIYKDPKLGYPEAKRLLTERYGDPYKVSTSYIKTINDWPLLKSGDDAALQRLSIFLIQCVSAMESLSYLHILDHPNNLQMLVKKLPYNLQERWRRHIVKSRQSGINTVP